MNRDDITCMAREAGFVGFDGDNGSLRRFAALVAAPLQERIQLLYEQLNEAEKQLDAQYQMGVEAEREACADVCEDTTQEYEQYTGQPLALNYTCAAAIRARGQT
jgi:hypothetical protein